MRVLICKKLIEYHYEKSEAEKIADNIVKTIIEKYTAR